MIDIVLHTIRADAKTTDKHYLKPENPERRVVRRKDSWIQRGQGNHKNMMTESNKRGS